MEENQICVLAKNIPSLHFKNYYKKFSRANLLVCELSLIVLYVNNNKNNYTTYTSFQI